MSRRHGILTRARMISLYPSKSADLFYGKLSERRVSNVYNYTKIPYSSETGFDFLLPTKDETKFLSKIQQKYFSCHQILGYVNLIRMYSFRFHILMRRCHVKLFHFKHQSLITPLSLNISPLLSRVITHIVLLTFIPCNC